MAEGVLFLEDGEVCGARRVERHPAGGSAGVKPGRAVRGRPRETVRGELAQG